MAAETKFLQDLFSLLNESGIAYAVARDWDALPESLKGSDLDLLTGNEHDMRKVFDIAVLAAKRNGGKVLMKYLVEMFAVSFGGQTDDGEWWGAHLDISVGNKYRGFFYLDPKVVMESRIWDGKGFYKVGGNVGTIAFFKELMANGRDRKGYYELARKDYRECPSIVKSAMLPCFGEFGYKLVKKILSEKMDPKQLCAIHLNIFAEVKRNYRRKYGTIKYFACVWLNLWRRFLRLFTPPGYFVVFLGTDGSGKSSVIEAIREPIFKMLHYDIIYNHLRPNWLPSLSCLFGRPQKDGPVVHPHSGKVAGRISSLIRFFYYLVDYTLGYWIRIHVAQSKNGYLFVNDRYYYDYFVDQRRLAVNVPMWLVSFFAKIIPKPDLVICLVGDPQKIYMRKPETSLKEVTRQVSILERFASNIRNAKVVSSTIALSETVNSVLTHIVDGMSSRYE